MATWRICRCKAAGLTVHVGCNHAGKRVGYATPRVPPESRTEERDDASEKMERRHDTIGEEG
jgi:hypothetical protein